MLSDKHCEIMTFVSKGYTNKEISNFMGVSVNTVKSHLANIMKELHVSNRAEATNVFLNSRSIRRIDLISVLIDEPESPGEISISLKSALFSSNLAKFYFDESYTPEYIIKIREGDGVCWVYVECLKGNRVVFQRNFGKPDYIGAAHTVLVSLIKDFVYYSDDKQSLSFKLYESLAILESLPASNIEPQYTALSELFDDQEGFSLAGSILVLYEYRMIVENVGGPLTVERKEKIENYAKKAMAADKNCTWAHLSMAINFLILGNKELSAEHLKQSIHIFPSNHVSIKLLAQIYSLMGRNDETIKLIDSALKVNPDLKWQGNMLAIKALVYFSMCDYEASLKYAEESDHYYESALLNQLVKVACLVYLKNEMALNQVLSGLDPESIKSYVQNTVMFSGEPAERFRAALRQAEIL